MNKIFKYPLILADEQKISLPIGAKVLTVQNQNETPCLWAVVNSTNNYNEDVTIRIYGTGQSILDIDNLEYVNTFQMMDGNLVFHVFIVKTLNRKKMNKQEFLAMSLPYDIICQTPVQDGICNNLILPLGGWIKGYLRFYHKGDFCNCDIDEVKPICRPLPDLTKPITQANYNNGKPFVPIEWLEDNHPTLDLHKQALLLVNDTPNWINQCDFMLVMQLIKWHFNLMDENEPFVDVNTLPENPYK